ncbi:MAG: hypothetical protein ACREFA_18715, partial [Stellaceae bacterium]
MPIMVSLRPIGSRRWVVDARRYDRPGASIDQSAAAQSAERRDKMRSGRAVETFEPVLVEKRGERRLTEFGLPQDA